MAKEGDIYIGLAGNAGPLATEVEKGIAALVKYEKAARDQADKIRNVIIAPNVDQSKIKNSLKDSKNWATGSGINGLFGKSGMSADTGHIANVKNGLLGIKTIVAGIAAGAVVGAASWMIKLSNDAEVAEASFATLLGGEDKAKQMMTNLNDYASKSSFSPKDLQEAANNLLAYGTAGNDVLPMLQMLGDVSQGNKEKMKSLALAMSQVQASGRLLGQDANQLINAGFGVWEQLSEMTGKTVPELKAMGEAGEVSFDMVKAAMVRSTEEGGRFAGAMDRFSKTTQGQWDGMVETFNLGAAKMGDFLKQTFAIDGLMETFSGWLQKGVDVLGQMQPVAEMLNQKWKEVLADMTSVVQPFLGSLGGIGGITAFTIDVFASLGKIGYAVFYGIKYLVADNIERLGQLLRLATKFVNLFGAGVDSTFADSMIAQAKKMKAEVAKGFDSVIDTALPGKAIVAKIDEITKAKKELAKVDLGNAKDKKAYDKSAEDDAAKLIQKMEEQINGLKGIKKEQTELQKLLANDKLDSAAKAKLKALSQELEMQQRLKKEQDEQKKYQKELADDAKKLAESLMTPAQKATKEIGRLQQMLKAGLITKEMFAHAKHNLEKGEHGKDKHEQAVNKAIKGGSQEARDLIIKHNLGASGPNYQKDSAAGIKELVALEKQKKNKKQWSPHLKVKVGFAGIGG